MRRRVEGLRTLALDTDGIAVIDTNDIDTGLKRIVADMSLYYLVGYYTKNAKLDGRFRKITVRVKRPGVNVRARRGYKAATAAELAPPTETGSQGERAAAAVQAALAGITSNRLGPCERRSLSPAVGSEVAGPVRMWTAVELDPSSIKGDFATGGDIAVTCRGADGTRAVAGPRHAGAGARTVVVDLATSPGRGRPRGANAHQATRRGRGVDRRRRRRRRVAGGRGAAAVAPRAVHADAVRRDGRHPVHRADRVRADVLVADASSTITASLLDRVGATIAVPVTVGARAEGAMTWATAELALAPLAPGDYVLKLTVAGPGGPSDV